jgi:hypothetical protein
MLGFQDLGWLQFERLCALLLQAESGIAPEAWEGSADQGRRLVSREPVRFAGRTLVPPVLVRCAWLRGSAVERRARLEWLAAGGGPLADDGGSTIFVGLPGKDQPPPGWPPTRMLLFNGDAATLAPLSHDGFLAAGEAEILAAIDRHPEVRLALPSVLALRPEPALNGSTLDLAAARELADVFVPTAAYERTLATLRRHHFAVLTGPPEMGKTATARMISLALLDDGWEAHECTRPEQFYERLDPARRQVFVADDAFGSTEYRPDAAERWARELDRILRCTGEHTWLIWTSRPAPLRAGLRAIHRERGGERFPQPAEVQVDASALGVDEKTLILFRHARAAQLTWGERRRVCRHGEQIVAHPHFTPERIRRFVAGRLRELEATDDLYTAIEAELAEPTEAMAASYAALGEEHRELLLAMLDCPPGPVAERDLAVALRRHATSPLPKAPAELVDRLADHFLRVIA